MRFRSAVVMGTCVNSPEATDSMKAALNIGSFFRQPAHLDQDSRRDQQRAFQRLQQSCAAGMMLTTIGPVSSSIVTLSASAARG